VTPRASSIAGVLVTAVLQATPPARPAAAAYGDVVEQFASSPNDAIARVLAMPAADVDRAVHDASQPDSGWSADALDRALLMHGDAAITLALDHRPEADRQQSLADEIATAAARQTGNEWFVHRWYKAFTARFPSPVVDQHWRQQPWFRAAAAVDRGLELESHAAKFEAPTEAVTYNPPEYRQAIPLFEQGLAGHFAVAAVHLGRIQMLRGNDAEATRLLEAGAHDPASRVNRYLAELFLGSLFERDAILASAEAHYRAALAALPRGQAGRFALAALLARRGHETDARLALADAAPAPFYDPWWSYFHGAQHAFIFSELHSEVCR
jgi:hypothetical protein